MSEITKEQLETIWRVLYEKTEFEHTFAKVVGNTGCSKCSCVCTMQNASKPCPIPDKLPKSLAEVAEDIREWLHTGKGNDVDNRTLYAEAIYKIYGDWHGVASYDDWHTFACTPLDKITSFCKIHDQSGKGKE